jgi:L-asparaginase/Glu-tRNA(Gln) amidotransferase subunit D
MSLSLLYTGGTLGGRRGERGPLRQDHAVSSFFPLLKRKLPASVRPRNLETIAVRPGLSENRTPADWPILALAVDSAFRRGAEGVVVAHGTDTLLHGACMLARMLPGIPIPVVFTGSNLPLEAPGSDAVQNLAHAFRAARARAARGVWVSFAGAPGLASLVLNPARARKEAFRADCFQPLWGGPAARVTGDGAKGGPLRLTWTDGAPRAGKAGRYTPCFEVDPAVALFTLYPGFDPRMIRRAVAGGVRGIVLAAYGSGTACTAPGRYDVSAAVRSVTRAGARVAVVSQHDGRVREVYGSTADLVRAGAQLMPETTPEAALAALMCGSSGS